MKYNVFIIFSLIFLLYCNSVQAYDIKESASRIKAKDAITERKRLFRVRVAKIQQYLKQNRSPLAGDSESFVRCGDINGIDPSLLVGITKAESSFGLYYQLTNNPFNWGVHNGLEFKSMEEGICTVARGLKQNYDTSTAYTIGVKFAPSSDGNSPSHWAKTVQGVVDDLN